MTSLEFEVAPSIFNIFYPRRGFKAISLLCKAISLNLTSGVLFQNEKSKHLFNVAQISSTVTDRLTHRVDREDSTIIILDTKLVPDFVLHACCFFIAGRRPVLNP